MFVEYFSYHIGSQVDPAFIWVPGEELESKGNWHDVDHITYRVPKFNEKYSIKPYYPIYLVV
uniref:Uncharacterized protein n=1 Tax=Arion vulgaris TaxID=1028688 RepID=A0A0B7AY51_9EUPU